MRCVIDTNVLISCFLARDSVPGKTVRKVLGDGKLVFTEPTLGELIAVLYREKFDRYTTLELRKHFLRGIVSASDIVKVTRFIRACRDEEDDKFLDAAVHGGAQYIITGDADLLELHPFMDIVIVTPADFLQTYHDL